MTMIDNEGQQQPKKITKFTALIAGVFGLFFLGFITFKYLTHQIENKLKAKSEISKSDNVDSTIFDLSDDYNSNRENLGSEVALNEVKERGAEFVYQILIKQQLQIDTLQQDLKALQGDFSKYQSQERIAKTVFAYVDLRDDFLSGVDYTQSLRNFSMIADFDVNLYAKTTELSGLLPHFLDEEKISQSFQKLIPDLIINKGQSQSSGIFAKIYHNISHLIIIRRTKEKPGNEIDNAIIQTEKLLKEGKYREAITILLAIDSSFHEVLKNFLIDLDNAAQVHELDMEIITYLKSLR